MHDGDLYLSCYNVLLYDLCHLIRMHTHSHTHSEVTLAETQAAVQSLDPTKPPKELHTLLARGFHLDIEQVPEAGAVSTPVAQLVERLQNGDTCRTGPKPA